MRSSPKSIWLRLNFRVNELEFEEALMRACKKDQTDFQLVVEHRFPRSFALHEEFSSKVRERQPGRLEPAALRGVEIGFP